LFGVPIDLAADAADYPHFPRPEREPGKETPYVEHPVLRILGVNEPYLNKDILEVFVHPLQFKFVCKPGKVFGAGRSAGQEDFVAKDHHRLSEIQGGKVHGRYGGDGAA